MIDTDYIEFDEATHTYTNIHGVVIPSVTQYIKKYCKPFDSDYWAEKKAIEANKTKEEILKEWDDKRDLGTIQHLSLRNFVESKGETNLHENISDWITNNLRLLIEDPDLTLYPEQIIYSEKLNLAGTVDLIVKHNPTNEMFPIDYKTDKALTAFFRTKNDKGELINCPRMKEPYDNYFDTNLNHYIVQIKKYSDILCANGYNCNHKKSQIWHLSKSKIYNNLFEPYVSKKEKFTI